MRGRERNAHGWLRFKSRTPDLRDLKSREELSIHLRRECEALDRVRNSLRVPFLALVDGSFCECLVRLNDTVRFRDVRNGTARARMLATRIHQPLFQRHRRKQPTKPSSCRHRDGLEMVFFFSLLMLLRSKAIVLFPQNTSYEREPVLVTRP